MPEVLKDAIGTMFVHQIKFCCSFSCSKLNIIFYKTINIYLNTSIDLQRIFCNDQPSNILY